MTQKAFDKKLNQTNSDERYMRWHNYRWLITDLFYLSKTE